MDRKLNALRAYYSGLAVDRVKLETQAHGFAYLDQLVSAGAALEYGELTGHGLLHKYKLSQVSEGLLTDLLRGHLRKSSNTCLYFHSGENSLFAFNIDNNRKAENTAPIAETLEAALAVARHLRSFGMTPLVLSSGRGYHVWGRMDRPVPNQILHEAMVRIAAGALAGLHRRQLDAARIKFNFYPDPRSIDVVSLRLFGTDHAKTGRFSQVVDEQGRLLDEESSWVHFLALAGQGPDRADLFLAEHRRLMAAF